MRVLLIYSWDDDISQRRSSRMKAGPVWRSFEVAQCFALQSEHEEPRGEAVFQRLRLAIEESEPDILLVHTGAAYHRAPQAFVECILRIRAAFPHLRLGFEHRSTGTDPLAQTGVFEESAEMQAAEAAFFGR